MKSHLTPEQISEWVLGARSGPVTRHIHSCALCRKEAGRFEETLVEFRSSVREWTESQFNPHFQIQFDRGESRSETAFRAGLAVVALVLCFFISLAVRRDARQTETRVNEGDAALLNRVDQEVARTVPGPMEPLLQLVAWDGNSAPEASSDASDR